MSINRHRYVIVFLMQGYYGSEFTYSTFVFQATMPIMLYIPFTLHLPLSSASVADLHSIQWLIFRSAARMELFINLNTP